MKYLIVLLCACGGAQNARTPVDGAIGGLARDRDSRDPVAKAGIHVRLEGEMTARSTTTGASGAFHLDHLRPGRYSLTAEFAGQPIDVENIDVRAGDIAIVDVTFTLGQPDPMHVDFGNPKDGAIEHFRPHHLASTVALIEGTVRDQSTRERVAGAVVTAYPTHAGDGTLQAVTDDQGRFKFEAPPGTYSVSAYYSIGGRGQIEVRRSDIHVAGAEGVVVPLWVELVKQ